jgi:hypothetical protein
VTRHGVIIGNRIYRTPETRNYVQWTTASTKSPQCPLSSLGVDVDSSASVFNVLTGGPLSHSNSSWLQLLVTCLSLSGVSSPLASTDWLPAGSETQSQSYIMTDGQSASVSWCQAPIWGPRPNFYYCETVSGFLMWGALSDERTGLSFTIAVGPRQRRHSQVGVPRD